MLAHELAHIKRGDWLIQMVAEMARAGYWFNPLVWIACRRLRLESEQATDDVVLHAGIDGSAYARAPAGARTRLLAPAAPGCPPRRSPAPSSLERRVRAMLNNRTNRAPITRAARPWHRHRSLGDRHCDRVRAGDLLDVLRHRVRSD